jgi:hypothetical protein
MKMRSKIIVIGLVCFFAGASILNSLATYPIIQSNSKDYTLSCIWTSDGNIYPNATAINLLAAINSLTSGTINIPAGTYSVSNLPFKSGITYQGQGINKTILSSGDTNPVFLGSGTYVTNTIIRDMTIIGNGKTVNGIDVHTITYMDAVDRIEDVMFLNCKYGINGSLDDREYQIKGCEFIGCTNGLYLYNNHPYVMESEFRGCTEGIHTVNAGGYHMFIFGCLFSANAIGINLTYANNARVEDCRFTQDSSTDIITGSYNFFTNNNIRVDVANGKKSECIWITGNFTNINGLYYEADGYSSSYNFTKGFIRINGYKYEVTIKNVQTVNSLGISGNFTWLNSNANDYTRMEISDCYIYLGRGQFINTTPTSGYFTHSIISNNYIYYQTAMTGVKSIMYIKDCYTYGNTIMGNRILNSLSAASVKYGLQCDARGSIVDGNNFRNTNGFHLDNTDSNTVNASNNDYV